MMGKYFEYDVASGRIISEITCSIPPEVSDGLALLEVNGTADIDTTLYGVRDGVLVRLYETNEERLERERLRRENAASARLRISSMTGEIGLALLENDEETIKRLRDEYRSLKAYL